MAAISPRSSASEVIFPDKVPLTPGNVILSILKWPPFHKIKLTKCHVDLMHNGTSQGIHIPKTNKIRLTVVELCETQIFERTEPWSWPKASNVVDKNIQVPHYMWDLIN